MAILNKILNILTLLLAGVALFFGYSLFERRVELRSHSEMVAKSMTVVVKRLDVASNTDVAAAVGDLGWKAFHDTRSDAGTYETFRNTKLAKIEGQVETIMKQRDDLAHALAEIAKNVDRNPLKPEIFQSVNDYEAGVTDLIERIVEVKDRDKLIFARIHDIAFNLTMPLPEGSLKDPTQCKAALDTFGANLNNLNKRSAAYVKTIVVAVDTIGQHDWQVNKDRLRSPTDYEGELAAIENDCAEINEDLIAYGRIGADLEKVKSELDDKKNELNDVNKNLLAREIDLDNCKTELSRCKTGPGGRMVDPQDPSKPLNPGDFAVTNVEGKIVEVNYDWNYVIIDLGRRDLIPKNMGFRVARGGEYICKVKVTRVLDEYCVADILPHLKLGVVMEGDRVIQ